MSQTIANKVTVSSEKDFAHDLRKNILEYWVKHGYHIECWIGEPDPELRSKHRFRIPIYPIRSNLSAWGFPPKTTLQ